MFKNELRSVMYVDDLESTEKYYTEVLGLKKVHSWNNSDNDKGCIIEVTGGGFLELIVGTSPIEQGATSLWMEAKDIDGMFWALKKDPRSNIFEDVEDKYYHARVFRIVDPDGNATFVCQYEKDVKPYTVDAVPGDFLAKEFRSVLFVEDLDACYRFYTEVLEMPCVYSWDEGPGDRGFKYKAAGSDAYIENLHRYPLVPQGATTIMVEAEDVDLAYARITAKGVKLISDISDKPYGVRSFEIMDPDENGVIIFSYI